MCVLILILIDYRVYTYTRYSVTVCPTHNVLVIWSLHDIAMRIAIAIVCAGVGGVFSVGVSCVRVTC